MKTGLTPLFATMIGLALSVAAAAQGRRGMPNATPEQSAAVARMNAALAPQMLELMPLLSAAARYAAHYKAVAIYFGLRVGSQGDDLSQATEYVQIWNELLQMPCSMPDVEVLTPLLELDPWQVIDVGYQVNAPLEKTWSCTEDGAEACWACRGCRRRGSRAWPATARDAA
jgi:hypothetical protein